MDQTMMVKNMVRFDLMNKINTDNVFLDTFLKMLIMSSQDPLVNFINYIKNSVLNLPYNIYLLILSIYRNILNKNIVTKKGVVMYITEDREINTLFEPVMWYICQETDTKMQDNIYMETTKDDTNTRLRVPNGTTSTINALNHEFRYNIKTEIKTIYAEREHKRENTIIELFVTTDKNTNQNIFKDFTDLCEKKYNEYQSKQNWQQKIYRNDNGEWKNKPSKSSRKLETIILRDNQLSEIREDVNDFIDSEDWYINQ